ncbi:MAG: methyltransferase domain-containing protein [Polyangiaceae bacterium]|nr:methyltransferase domain-containing protein [Polyangiaceae bacterium]
MHAGAYDFVSWAVKRHGPFGRVVEFGGADINGSVRPLFGAAEYLSIDEHDAPGVDLVADVASWDGEGGWDCVVCTEVLEHAIDPGAICASAYRALRAGGVYIVTAAGEGRPVHYNWSMDEHYLNVTERALLGYLDRFRRVLVRKSDFWKDIYATAVK